MALEKVLVVDDDPNICDVLRMYLENEGYSVILAYDGEEALVKFNALKPDIILLDVMLPTLDGWQVCREVRKKSSVPIIMITAKGDTFDKVLGLELGADDYIVKPFDTKEVIARIKAIARRVGNSPEESEVKEVRYDKLSVNMTRYELRVDGKVVDCAAGSAVQGQTNRRPYRANRLHHLFRPFPVIRPCHAAGQVRHHIRFRRYGSLQHLLHHKRRSCRRRSCRCTEPS